MCACVKTDRLLYTLPEALHAQYKNDNKKLQHSSWEEPVYYYDGKEGYVFLSVFCGE